MQIDSPSRNEEYSHKMFFHFHPQTTYLKLSKFLGNMTAWVCIKTNDYYIVVSFWQNKQIRPRLLVLVNFMHCLPPEKPRVSMKNILGEYSSFFQQVRGTIYS